MKNWVNLEVRREEELICDWIDLVENFEGSDISGT